MEMKIMIIVWNLTKGRRERGRRERREGGGRGGR
jgi:hypothetical protein